MRFQIGQEVWQAEFEAFTNSVECPDCAGTGRIRCLLPDDTMVCVECEGCRRGYDGPTGRVPFYDWMPRANLVTITGVEIEGGKTKWRTSNSYRVSEDRLFDNEGDAIAAANALAEEHNKAERDKINQREKPTKSWAWNVHYHRNEIREAQRRLEYHTKKLAVANLKAKQVKVALNTDKGEGA